MTASPDPADAVASALDAMDAGLAHAVRRLPAGADAEVILGKAQGAFALLQVVLARSSSPARHPDANQVALDAMLKIVDLFDGKRTAATIQRNARVQLIVANAVSAVLAASSARMPEDGEPS